MLGYLSLHRDRVRGELGTHLSRVEREARRCKEIVEGLLQLARPVEAFAPMPVDLREVGDEVAEALRMAAGPGAPTLRVEGAGNALGGDVELDGGEGGGARFTLRVPAPAPGGR
jgi:signal transduction histidine kinase